jgi:hypothetical protein
LKNLRTPSQCPPFPQAGLVVGKFVSNILKIKSKVKCPSSLQYFLYFSYKNEIKFTKKVHFSFIFGPLDPVPGSGFPIWVLINKVIESGSTTLPPSVPYL